MTHELASSSLVSVSSGVQSFSISDLVASMASMASGVGWSKATGGGRPMKGTMSWPSFISSKHAKASLAKPRTEDNSCTEERIDVGKTSHFFK
ncbi:hypothetical protein BDW59DRAFT_32876 [Aspergillus cavernicola]|uniref:Uncharacterized protein n=1 Tax=Aspergillus cavernicola TaxID=176166 RepID=A0ABR4IPP4_9EURO